jgi:multidrug efflux pump subunit AcrA (membrane-fusion protein)
VEGAKRKLLLLGLTPAQVKQIISKRREIYSFPIYSPYSGYLAEVAQSAPFAPLPGMNQSPADDGMGGSMGGQASTLPAVPTSATSNPSSLIREGMYVSPGQTLFKIINPSVVWAEVNLTSDQALSITKGMPVAVKLGQGEWIDGKVNLVQPFFTKGQQFARVRISLVNKNNIRIGQLVEASIELKNRAGLWVPATSILDLGTRKIAFVKSGNTFSAKVVSTGERINEQIKITKGLSTESLIAANANFLVDSEGFIMTENQ